MRRHVRIYGDIRSLPDKAAIQLNDTHPSIAVAELMRLLVDVHGLAWDEAWGITVRTLSYTNHTLLPEALETWPVPLFERMLPRHLADHLRDQRAPPRSRCARAGSATTSPRRRVSLIDEHHGRHVRMGHLAFIGSHRVNGVSALHTDLMRETVFHDLHRLYPDRIVNKTNGITFRRWLHQANPGLTQLLVETCGGGGAETTPTLLESSRTSADDPALQDDVAAIRHANKVALARVIRDRLDIRVDPSALFDVQIKRIHEYKRQLLNLLETIALYQAIRADPDARLGAAGKDLRRQGGGELPPGEAHHPAGQRHRQGRQRRPGDARPAARWCSCRTTMSAWPRMIIPAADLSEQISTAGMEASGTGNMKLALNGALTIGTLDGANIEIREHVGPENIFIFGLTAGGGRRAAPARLRFAAVDRRLAARSRARSTRFRRARSRPSRSTATTRSPSRSATTIPSW